MTTRRTFSMTALGALAGYWSCRDALAQSADTEEADPLQRKGAPTGRVGAATRGIQRGGPAATLDLVAPQKGLGLTSIDSPTLYYMLSDGTNAPLRLTITTKGEARPLADQELPRPLSRFSSVDLSALKVRLAPGLVYVWSVSLRLDPNVPAHDLVASALIQYQPGTPAFVTALRDAPADQRHALLAQNGYWYDEVALAAHDYPHDNGVALTDLLRKAGLQAGTSTSAH
jgi:hypothetical protein